MHTKTKFNNNPLLKHESGGTFFYVYKAKNLYNSQWLTKRLKKKVIQSRQSFLRYGKLPLLDAYDKKAAVYLAKAKYNSSVNLGNTFLSGNIEEWLSVRFVPGNKSPLGNPDLKECLWGKEPLEKSITHSRIFVDSKNFLAKLVSISKICGSSRFIPHNLDKNKKYDFKNENLKYTPILFALMNKQFLDDIHNDKIKFSYITGLFRNELIQKRLTMEIKKSVRRPRFTNADVFFNTDPADIHINRRKSAYWFPSYFLKLDELIAVLQNLISQKRLSETSLKHYLKIKPNLLKQYTNNLDKITAFRNLGSMLKTNGKIYGSDITGEELRKILDVNVNDGAQLKIMQIERWRKDIERVVSFAVNA